MGRNKQKWEKVVAVMVQRLGFGLVLVVSVTKFQLGIGQKKKIDNCMDKKILKKS